MTGSGLPQEAEREVPFCIASRPANRHHAQMNGTAMTRSRLVDLLEAEGVDAAAYRVDGTSEDECLVLEVAPGGWAVYYAERGLRTEERQFDTEDEACRFMLDRLLADPGNRRRA